MMLSTHKWKRDKKFYANYKFLEASQNERIGAKRLCLVETLLLIIKNDKLNKYKLLEKIEDQMWHLL